MALKALPNGPTHTGTTVRKLGACGFGAVRAWRVPAKSARALVCRRRHEAETMRRSMIPAYDELCGLTTPQLQKLCVQRGLNAAKTKVDRAKWRDRKTKIFALSRLRRRLPKNGAKMPPRMSSPRDSEGRIRKFAEADVMPMTLTAKPFEVMVTGEKREEFRENSRWARNRLMHPDGSAKLYSEVEFTNGYGNKRPRFYAKYLGFSVKPKVYRKYSNGLVVKCHKRTFVLHLGKITRKTNMHLFRPQSKWRIRCERKEAQKSKSTSAW